MLSPDIVQEIFEKLKEDPKNSKCADCGKPDPEFTSLTYGIFICVDCKEIHQSIRPNLSVTKLVSNKLWTLNELKYIVASGNSAFEEFLSFYGLKDLKLSVKYRTTAVEFYRNMLQAIVEKQVFRGFLPRFESAKLISNESQPQLVVKEESKLDLKTHEIAQVKTEAKAQVVWNIPSVEFVAALFIMKKTGLKNRFKYWIKTAYSDLVNYGNKLTEKSIQISKTPTFKKIDDNLITAIDSIEKFVSRLYQSAQAIRKEYDPQIKLVDSNEIMYRQVFADFEHTFDNINTDERVIGLKREIMILLDTLTIDLRRKDTSSTGIMLRQEELEATHEEETYFVEP